MLGIVMLILNLLVAIAVLVRADPNPNSPGPGDVFIQGKPCAISWDADPTGRWKTMVIELMTGDNFDMVSLTPVGTVDGTNPHKSSYSYTCPQVTPHSPIYFYQFSSPSTSNKTWTGRFTITDSTQDVVPPSQSTQPDGTKIPWGKGSLMEGSSREGALVIPSASPTNTSSSAASATSGSTSVSMTGSNTGIASSSDTPSTAAATPSTVTNTGTNGAVLTRTTLDSNILFQTIVALGLAAYGFAVIF